MTLVTQAVIFAAQAHDGALRKGSETPYIVHPMEVVSIAATLTDDPQVLAAAALHDVLEDCDVEYETLCQQFGQRVANLVRAESQIRGGNPCQSWGVRKRDAVRRLAGGCRATKIIAIADKLSNMRAISRDYAREGETVFLRFHQQDKRMHAWYYRSCAAQMEGELGLTQAFCELTMLIDRVFGGVPSLEPEEGGQTACAG